MKDDARGPSQEQIDAQKKYIELEKKEMLSAYNKYCAFLELGREPSDNEAAMHYIRNGGAKKFHEKYGHLLCLISEDKN